MAVARRVSHVAGCRLENSGGVKQVECLQNGATQLARTEPLGANVVVVNTCVAQAAAALQT